MISRILAVLSLLFFLGTGVFVSDSQIPKNASQLVTFRTAIDLPPLPHLLGSGELTLVGGWELESQNTDFGGFSALHTAGDGRLLALSDAAVLAGFTLGSGSVARDAFIAPLPVRKGERSTKMDQDAESLAHDPVSGRFWVGFEQLHRIRRYSPAFARAEATGKPDAMQGWPSNGGAEAILRRDDGSFLVFSEARAIRPGVTIGLIYATDPAEPGAPAESFGYMPPEGYRITDIAALPDGRMLTLNRRFSMFTGISAKIGMVKPEQIAAGRVVVPRIIATLEPPLPVDNMEGIAVEQERGRTFVWIISDDNFFPFQRTLLLKFVLGARASGARASPRP